MEYKLSRTGRFMSCKRFPDCLGARQEDGSEIQPPTAIGTDPESGEDIFVLTGRFGPYIAHQTKPKPDFRSLKTDDVYAIELPRALEILKEEKKKRGFAKKKKA
jgi:DNA topoisomerase-1